MLANEEWKRPYAALVGIDWADQEHAFFLRDVETGRAVSGVLLQTPEEIDKWAWELHQTYGGRLVGICLEQSKGALLYALMKYPHLHLYPLDGKKLRRFRESYVTSGDRDDPGDAEFLWEYLDSRGHTMRVLKPDTEETRLLAQLNEDRRDTVDDRTRLSNQALICLKGFFPLAIRLLGGDLTTPLALDFLERWATLEDLKKSRPATIEKFFCDHGCHLEELNRKRLEAIGKAVALVTDRAIIQASVLKMQRIVGQLRELNKAIARYDERIDELMEDHADARIFQSLPGAGHALAPRLLTLFGTDRARWEVVQELQCLDGIVPVRDYSGKSSKRVKFRWACAKFRRQTWVEFAEQSIRQCAWAKAFYEKRKAEGLKHNAILRELAVKWSRIVFRCWKDGVPYDEGKYLQSLIRRNSPILEFMKA
jgi:transposase